MSLERELARRLVELRMFGIEWTIGRYVVEGELGAGGMGTVFRGRDPELGRAVAIKLLRTAQTPEARTRLLREGQALASLAHPNVVAVFEVGTYAGTPFIVMEHVAGRTLGQWRSELAPGLAQVLETYLAAGRGLAAAHDRDIVHRDFKPSNVIVGDDGRPRVLDFGIAKTHGPWVAARTSPLLGAAAVGTTLDGPSSRTSPDDLTGTSVVMGTPLYMAPEQRGGHPADPHCDQYSFCVALYEALYGVHPFAAPTYEALIERAYEGRVGAPPAGTKVPAAWRRILLRGLAPRPSARYPDMRALLRALEGASSRRRSGTLGLLAALCTALVVGAAVWPGPADDPCESAEAEAAAAWDEPRRARIEQQFDQTGLVYARAVWEDADAHLRAYVASLGAAQRSACESPQQEPAMRVAQELCLDRRRRALASFAERLETIDAVGLENASAAMDRVLDDPARCLDAELLSRPVPPPTAALAERVSALREAITDVEQSWSLGHYAQSDEAGQRVVEDARALGYPPALAEALLAAGLAAHGNGDLARSLRTLEEGYFVASTVPHDEVMLRAAMQLVVVATEHDELDPAEEWSRHARSSLERTHAPDAQWATWHGDEATRLDRRGEYEAALEHLERALELVRASPAAGSLDQVRVHVAMGIGLGRRGRLQEGLEHLQQARGSAVRVLPEGHPQLATIIDTIGSAYGDMHRFEEALEHTQQALAMRELALGPDHPDLALSHHNVAHALMWLARYPKAKAHVEQAVAISERNGADPTTIVMYRHLLARILRDAGEPDRAIPVLERAIEELGTALGPAHPKLASVANDLGLAHAQAGHVDQATAAFRTSITIGEAALGPIHPTVAIAHDNLGAVLYQAERIEEALAEHRAALHIREQLPDSPPALLASSYHNLGCALESADHRDEAIAMLRRAVDVGERLAPTPEDRMRLGASLTALGASLSRSGDTTEAPAVLEQALRVIEALEPPEPPRLAAALTTLGEHHLRVDRPDRALGPLEQAIAIPRPRGEDRGHVAKTSFYLARALVETGGDRRRALALARAARQTWAELGDWPEYLAQVDPWLRRHGGE